MIILTGGVCGAKSAAFLRQCGTLAAQTLYAAEVRCASRTRDWHGKTVAVRVPSQSATDIRGKDTEGTVWGTITAVDPAAHRVRVRTSEGQTIVLAMAPDSLAGLKPGDLFIFTIPEAPRT